jgi:hypothetical protein
LRSTPTNSPKCWKFSEMRWTPDGHFDVDIGVKISYSGFGE